MLTINGRCSKAELALTAFLTKALLLKQVSWRCLWGQEHTLPPWHPAPAGPDLLSPAWWSSWTLPHRETGERCPLETEYDWLTTGDFCFAMSQSKLKTPADTVNQGYTRQVPTLTMIGHRSAGDTIQGWVFFQRQGQGQQPKDTEGQQRMHGSFVQAKRNISFIVSFTVTHTGGKTASGIYDVMRSVLTEGLWPLYWPRSAGCPWRDGWHRPKKQSRGGLKETRLYGYHNQFTRRETWQEGKFKICPKHQTKNKKRKENEKWKHCDTFKMCLQQSERETQQKEQRNGEKGQSELKSARQ